MSRGVQSSVGGSGAGMKVEYPSRGTSLPGVFAVLSISPSFVAKRNKIFIFDIHNSRK
jgi:hypothetical protein